MATAGLVWTRTPAELGRSVQVYGKRLIQALHLLADHFAAVLESYAKQTAPWTDRSGAARQGLAGLAVKAATGVTIILAYSVSYGIFLELKNAGKYAVIIPTLEKHYAEIFQAAKALVS